MAAHDARPIDGSSDKPHPAPGSHGPFPGELAVHELLVVRALVKSGRSLWTAIYHVREQYQTNYAASYVVRSADALGMRCTWLSTEEALAVVRGAIELAYGESGLTTMPRAADAPARLQCEFERQRNVRLENSVFKCIARASGRAQGGSDAV